MNFFTDRFGSAVKSEMDPQKDGEMLMFKMVNSFAWLGYTYFVLLYYTLFIFFIIIQGLYSSYLRNFTATCILPLSFESYIDKLQVDADSVSFLSTPLSGPPESSISISPECSTASTFDDIRRQFDLDQLASHAHLAQREITEREITLELQALGRGHHTNHITPESRACNVVDHSGQSLEDFAIVWKCTLLCFVRRS